MTSLHIKKGDTVRILSGDDKGKTGKVILVMPGECKVVVEGINMMKRHERSRKQNQKGQVVEKAMPIHASNVALSEKKAKAVKVAKATKTVKATKPKAVKAK